MALETFVSSPTFSRNLRASLFFIHLYLLLFFCVEVLKIRWFASDYAWCATSSKSWSNMIVDFGFLLPPLSIFLSIFFVPTTDLWPPSARRAHSADTPTFLLYHWTPHLSWWALHPDSELPQRDPSTFPLILHALSGGFCLCPSSCCSTHIKLSESINLRSGLLAGVEGPSLLASASPKKGNSLLLQSRSATLSAVH